MGKYDLSSPLAIQSAAKAANIQAKNEPGQSSYNAAWLHGYASALQDAAGQLEPFQRLVDEVLNYLGEHHDQSQLYDMFHGDIGMTDEEIEFLGFDLPDYVTGNSISQNHTDITISNTTKDSFIKQWYLKAFPTDSLGAEIRDNFTFTDAFHTLENKACIYEALGVLDSVVRERVFEELAQLYGVEYGVIYDMWCYEKMPLSEQIQTATDRISFAEPNNATKEQAAEPDL